MKKKITLVLATILCLSFMTGCQSKEEKKREQLVKKAEQAAEKGDYEKAVELASEVLQDTVSNATDNKEESDSKNSKAIEVKDAALEADGASFVIKSYKIQSGSKLLVTYDFTNKSDYPQSFSSLGFSLGYSIRLYQDGAELTSAFSSDVKDLSTQIKSGATIEVVNAYQLRNETSDVEFELYASDSTYTLKLAK